MRAHVGGRAAAAAQPVAESGHQRPGHVVAPTGCSAAPAMIAVLDAPSPKPPLQGGAICCCAGRRACAFARGARPAAAIVGLAEPRMDGQSPLELVCFSCF